MNSKVVLGVTLRFDDVFDEQIKPPLEYLQGINQATLLHIASHFLGFKKDSENNNYRTFRRGWCLASI